MRDRSEQSKRRVLLQFTAPPGFHSVFQLYFDLSNNKIYPLRHTFDQLHLNLSKSDGLRITVKPSCSQPAAPAARTYFPLAGCGGFLGVVGYLSPVTLSHPHHCGFEFSLLRASPRLFSTRSSPRGGSSRPTSSREGKFGQANSGVLAMVGGTMGAGYCLVGPVGYLIECQLAFQVVLRIFCSRISRLDLIDTGSSPYRSPVPC